MAELGDSELDVYLGFCERALLGERRAGESEGSGMCLHTRAHVAVEKLIWNPDVLMSCWVSFRRTEDPGRVLSPEDGGPRPKRRGRRRTGTGTGTGGGATTSDDDGGGT